MSRTMKEVQDDISAAHTKDEAKMTRMADDEALDKSLVRQAEQLFKTTRSEINSVVDFFDAAKPDHALDNDELKQSIAECQKLLQVIRSLRYITT